MAEFGGIHASVWFLIEQLEHLKAGHFHLHSQRNPCSEHSARTGNQIVPRHMEIRKTCPDEDPERETMGDFAKVALSN
ncbi:MAG: hypothetical protein O3B13_06035 [Planctomycetota bacterium]|nr:hypothetical protein [Planctomycetota bacterium]MDA1162639.1 hypothetical protein [Planctomycetota bacterium]